VSRWRPFYWDTLGDDWIFRAASTLGLACLAFVAALFVAAVCIGIADAL
jgi:hypothetical protein